MRNTFILIALLTILSIKVHAQTVEVLSEGTKTSIRGLSVVDDRIIWVSGSNGTIGKSIDSGKTWKWSVVKGFEKRDFRDIEAFDATTAIVIAIAEPANILKTVDGGETWKVVYENKTPGMFLDAMEFWNEQSGIVLGDPINGKFFIARTFDEGDTWKEIPFDNLPKADSGEACFAASGTNIRALDRDEACFVSGGTRSRLFWKGTPIELPIIQGKETTGANSVAVRDNKKLRGGIHMVVVGGDFAADSSMDKNCFVTTNGGKTWKAPLQPPHGYRSCVEYINANKLIACGTSGVDVSADGGMKWKLVTKQGFHVCRKAKEGKAVFLAGGNGRIAKLVW
ncbi:MAG TPA: oxidoreductase [Chitinophagaceae bacterium]|nr:oxidoreductase [Chitinophagaceae bacterium]